MRSEDGSSNCEPQRVPTSPSTANLAAVPCTFSTLLARVCLPSARLAPGGASRSVAAVLVTWPARLLTVTA